ncbi:MAG: 30S ribosome-binding factor RbfA [Syntrophales bacterium]|jgi:ribosome-binding factor A|nr:30S ribosome-binding factor RbfA [Syntrophales bacterium]MDY0043333.1 30S ribosome-binding factor RbfA [Syntrophales bacterium]
MTIKRAERVADLIKEEISRIVLREVRDPRIRDITITEVKVTDDLRFARIYFTPLGKNNFHEDTIAGLRQAKGFMRRELGKQLRLRYVPDLEFLFDESFAYGDRIERILADLHKAERPDGEEDS